MRMNMDGLAYKKLYESEDFKETYLHNRTDWGATYSKEETVFRVWSPFAELVQVCLYKTGTDEEEGAKLIDRRPMVPVKKGLWQCTIPGDLNGVYYTYQVRQDGDQQECIDPYARAAGANGKRGMVIDLKSTNPISWEEDEKWHQTNENTVIYELHVKDFSYKEESGIKKEYRGKYLAFTQEGTFLNGKRNWFGKKKTGINYLKSLGVTHVHLLPVFDFASLDETNCEKDFNWGYDPMNYNVPEGAYATDARHGEVRIKEFKKMVQALHNAGIAVVMDVVYNHTYSSVETPFHVLAPYYYYRQNEDGSFSNGSACGNETASERKMFGQFMIDSVHYWAKEYHIDGFRFDLMGLHDTQTMNEIRKDLDASFPNKKILLYGEPWVASDSPMEAGYYPAVKANMEYLNQEIGFFCDSTRDAIKGSVFIAEEPGFVNGGSGLEAQVAASVIAWCDHKQSFKPVAPSQHISYVSAHDNYTLWDKLILTGKKKSFLERDETILGVNKMTAGIVFTCMGTPFFQAGEEFARTKEGDENSYQSSPEINALDWRRKEEFEDLVEYYQGLIGLRGQIAFYRDKSMKAVDRVKFLLKKNNMVIFVINNSYGQNEPWKEILVIYNSKDSSYTMKLPSGEWQILVDSESSLHWKGGWGRHKKKYCSKEIEIKNKSIAVLGK